MNKPDSDIDVLNLGRFGWLELPDLTWRELLPGDLVVYRYYKDEVFLVTEVDLDSGVKGLHWWPEEVLCRSHTSVFLWKIGRQGYRAWRRKTACIQCLPEEA